MGSVAVGRICCYSTSSEGNGPQENETGKTNKNDQNAYRRYILHRIQ